MTDIFQKDAKRIAEQIDDAINTTAFNPFNVAAQMVNGSEGLMGMHRYTQNEMFKLCLNFIFQEADAYRKGHYDGRNEFACRVSHKIKQLIENEGREYENNPDMWSVCNQFENNKEDYNKKYFAYEN